MLTTGGASACQSAGQDIRFTTDAAGASPLHYEIVGLVQAATPSTGASAEIWVALTSLSSVSNTFYMWYGNSTASAPTASDATWGSQGVWDTHYSGVWHIGFGSTVILTDSTSNANTMTNSGSITAGAGATGGAGYFNGGAGLSRSSFTACPSGNSHLTASVWMNNNAGISIPNMGLMFGKDSTNPWGYGVYVNQTSYYPTAAYASSNGAATGTGAVATTMWCYLCGVYTGTTNSIFVNGALGATPTSYSSGNIQASGGMYIGRWSGGQDSTNGYIGEVRVSNIDRTTAWIVTEYNNQSAPASFISAGTPTSTPLADGWSRKITYSIAPGKVSGTGTLSNFPVLITYRTSPDNSMNLPAEMLTTGGAYACQSAGKDIRFTSDSAGLSPLHSEIVGLTQSATPTTAATAEIWVALTSVSSVSSTFYLWYGNPNAAAALSTDATWGSQGVWDTHYSGVWHIGYGASVILADSTSNANVLTNAGSITATTGATGGAGYFNGGNGLTKSSFSGQPTANSPFTVSSWVHPNAGLGGQVTVFMFGADSVSPYGYGTFVNSGTYYGSSAFDSNNGPSTSTVALTPSAWNYLVGVYSATTNSVFINGALGTTPTSYSSAAVQAGGAYIGRWSGTQEPMYGSIGEVRVSNIARSADWIATEFNNQYAPGSFFTLPFSSVGGVGAGIMGAD